MQHVGFLWPPAEELTRFVREARSGRPGALDELLDLLRPALVSFFERRFALDTADDLAQPASIRICGAIQRIDPERADSYIATIARNLLRTAYRRQSRDMSRADETSPEELPTRGVSADRRVEYEDLVRAVHRACAEKLRPGLREVAAGLLRGDTPVEIARALEVSPVTVRTRLMRVRAILREELSSYLETNGAADRQAR
jgi:RNA polymerase sigma factor (sigma-70 family)